MKLSDFALKSLVPIIIGEAGVSKNLTGPNLVDFFNLFGLRDIYDMQNGGLPKLPDRDSNTSRKDYTFDRLKKINDSKNLKLSIEKIVNDNVSNEIIVMLNGIINSEGYKIEKGDTTYFIVGHENYPEEIAKEVEFEEIQARILDELSKARFQILIAVAWFTDKVIFQKLLDKKKEGVNIQVLISDDEINKASGLDFERNFETYRIKKTGYDNLMHNKFCVIDLQTVINGSYNWSRKAQYNKENITIDYSRQLSEQFAQKFIDLKLGKS
jgi:phosphatidylserine/phosphatidylglycerophosphate/cardiolipin synthase-like enzyme